MHEEPIHCTHCNGAGGKCITCGEGNCRCSSVKAKWQVCPYCCGQGTIDVVDASPEVRRARRALMADA